MSDSRMDPEEYQRVFGPLAAKHFTPEDEARWREREIAEGEGGQQAWEAVIAEGKALLAEGLDPGAREAMDLAVRWMALLERFSGGDPQVHAKIEAMWREAFQDQQFRERSPMSPELMEWVGMAIRSAHAAGLMPYPGRGHAAQA